MKLSDLKVGLQMSMRNPLASSQKRRARAEKPLRRSGITDSNSLSAKSPPRSLSTTNRRLPNLAEDERKGSHVRDVEQTENSEPQPLLPVRSRLLTSGTGTDFRTSQTQSRFTTVGRRNLTRTSVQ